MFISEMEIINNNMTYFNPVFYIFKLTYVYLVFLSGYV